MRLGRALDCSCIIPEDARIRDLPGETGRGVAQDPGCSQWVLTGPGFPR